MARQPLRSGAPFNDALAGKQPSVTFTIARGGCSSRRTTFPAGRRGTSCRESYPPDVLPHPPGLRVFLLQAHRHLPLIMVDDCNEVALRPALTAVHNARILARFLEQGELL